MDIIEGITSKLESAGVLDNSGTAFMSHKSTLRKGKYLVVGINPGGISEGCYSIRQSFEEFQKPSYSPLNEKWENDKYQKGIKSLFEHLNVDINSVCITNLIYERSKTEKDLPVKSTNTYREILASVVLHIQPEVIFVLGKRVFEEVKSILNAEEDASFPAAHGRYLIYTTEGQLKDQKVKVICLPHLSRYALYVNRQKQLDFIKSYIG